jgi:phosphonate transport system substrate-binding protein
MDFQQAEKSFRQLKNQFESGTLSEPEFKTQLEELMVQDERGDWWMIGYETEQWYRHDGTNWVQTEPPSTPTQQPETPYTPVAQPSKLKPRNWLIYGAIIIVVVVLCSAIGIWILTSLVNPPASPEEMNPPAPTELTNNPSPASPVAETPSTQPLEIGTSDHPIRIVFVPSGNLQVITNGGEILASALNEATGLYFEVLVPTSYAASIEEMCASTADSMGFLPGIGYAIANQLCGVDVSFAAVRFGSPAYWGEVLVHRDSFIQSIADLNGLRWGIPDKGSTSGYMLPLAIFQETGIEPGNLVETGGHNQAVLAVYNGEVDFATVFYSAPLNPDGAPAWTYEDYVDGRVTPDIWDIPISTIPNCAPTPEGRLFCDGWRVMDARANIREEAPDVVQNLRILELSPAVPNEVIAFGFDFPVDVRAPIEQALINLSKTETWGESIGNSEMYAWDGLYQIADAEYDIVRKMVNAAGLTLDDLR